MTVLDWVHTLSGFFIVASLALGFWVSPYWYLFTAFVGANLFQFGFSRFCLLSIVLRKLGVPETDQNT